MKKVLLCCLLTLFVVLSYPALAWATQDDFAAWCFNHHYPTINEVDGGRVQVTINDQNVIIVRNQCLEQNGQVAVEWNAVGSSGTLTCQF